MAHRLWAAAAVISLQAAAVCTMVFVFTPVEMLRNTHYSEPAGVAVSRLLWIWVWTVVTPAVALIIGGVISEYAFPSVSRTVPLKGDAA